MEFLEWVGLADKADVYPDKLSGGRAYDPVTEGDRLSSLIVTRLSRDIRYERTEKNHLRVLL